MWAVLSGNSAAISEDRARSPRKATHAAMPRLEVLRFHFLLDPDLDLESHLKEPESESHGSGSTLDLEPHPDPDQSLYLDPAQM